MARRTRLYQPGPYPSEGEILELDSEGSHHLGRVLRFQKGWNLELFDNSGSRGGGPKCGWGRSVGLRWSYLIRCA